MKLFRRILMYIGLIPWKLKNPIQSKFTITISSYPTKRVFITVPAYRITRNDIYHEHEIHRSPERPHFSGMQNGFRLFWSER